MYLNSTLKPRSSRILVAAKTELRPNDIVYVAPLKQKSWGTGATGFQSFTTVVTILSFLVSSVLLVKNL